MKFRINPLAQLAFLTVILLLAGVQQVLATSIAVRGAVNKQLNLSVPDLKKMAPFHVEKVTLLEEKKLPEDPEKLIAGLASYKGVLLRDVLERAGMKYVRKFEPGVYVRVTGRDGKQVAFSFGEVFYSSIGRSIVLAYERDEKVIGGQGGAVELVVSTDLRSGRRIADVQEIVVERVDVELKAYEDRAKKIGRPPSTKALFTDKSRGVSKEVSIEDFKGLPIIPMGEVVMNGDCEGFKGVFSFEGPSLRAFLERMGITASGADYNRLVLLSSESGYCATFSLGEIFGSRFQDNIIVAVKRNGSPLDFDGFARSVVREDSLGGRSVRCINRIEIF
jgi:hypothetical protein